MQSRVSHDADHRKNHKKKYVSFGGPGHNQEFDAIKKTSQNTKRQPFFYKGATVLSEWNRYGIVRKAFKENKKVIVMVAYYAKDIPTTWDIGGIRVPSLACCTDPNTIIVIGHDSYKLKLV
jgi:hypothetical protein